MFSAMDASVATEIERAFAHSRPYRSFQLQETIAWSPDVPLLVPEVNPDHLKILPVQEKRGWKGTNYNKSQLLHHHAHIAVCERLKPMGISKVLVTTMQAISGAGYPGHSALRHERQRYTLYR